MALYLVSKVLLSSILAFSLTSMEQYVSSLDSMKNASGRSITKVNTMKESPRLLSENVHQIEQVLSLHDTPMSDTVQPIAASTSTTNTTTTTPIPCPQSGYQLYPEYNCYKLFAGEFKAWSEAREQCMSDGGDLMVSESEQERKDVYIPLYNSLEFYSPIWMGVYIPQGGNNWTTVKGEPTLSTWWKPGLPDGNNAWNCAFTDSTGLLVNYNCGVAWTFICEISL